MYFKPSQLTCTVAQILQLEGFLLAYGGLVLKTWRECKLFYVRSVKTIKITDKSLMKRLGIIMLVGTTYLIAWSLRRDDSPREQLKFDPDGLKYETCTITEWNFVSMACKLCYFVLTFNLFVKFFYLFIFSSSIGDLVVGRCFVSASSTRVHCFQRDQANHVGYFQ